VRPSKINVKTVTFDRYRQTFGFLKMARERQACLQSFKPTER